MRTIGPGSFKVETRAAVRKCDGADIAEGTVAVGRLRYRRADRCERSILLPRKASPLKPILSSGRTAVVEHSKRVFIQDRRYPGSAGVPAAGCATQYDALVMPVQSIHAGCVLGDHAILLPRLIERMAAHPHPPALRPFHDHRILDCPLIITSKD